MSAHLSILGVLLAMSFAPIPIPSAPVVVEDRRPRLVLLTRLEGCPPCARFAKWEATSPVALQRVKLAKWYTDREDHKEQVRATLQAMKWSEVSTPTFILCNHRDEVLGFWHGFNGPAWFTARLVAALYPETPH